MTNVNIVLCDSCKNFATTTQNCEGCMEIFYDKSFKNANRIGKCQSMEDLLFLVKTIEDDNEGILYPDCIISAVLRVSTQENIVENYKKILCSSTVTTHLEVIMDEIKSGEDIVEDNLEKEEPTGYFYGEYKKKLVLYKYVFSTSD